MTALDDHDVILSEESVAINKSVLNELPKVVHPRNHTDSPISDVITDRQQCYRLF
jgi:hypothetical protein